MSIPRENNAEAGVLVLFDARTRPGVEAFIGWDRAGLLREPPERLEEGVFVATLRPGVHDVVKVVER